MSKYLLGLLCCLLPFLAQAQMVKGRITNAQNQPLKGAAILWKGSQNGVESNAEGRFEIALQPKQAEKILQIIS